MQRGGLERGYSACVSWYAPGGQTATLELFPPATMQVPGIKLQPPGLGKPLLLSHLSSPAWFGFKHCSLDFITIPPNQTPLGPCTPSLHLFPLRFVLLLTDVGVTGQGLRSILHLGQQRRLFAFLGNRSWHQEVTTADVQGRLSF